MFSVIILGIIIVGCVYMLFKNNNNAKKVPDNELNIGISEIKVLTVDDILIQYGFEEYCGLFKKIKYLLLKRRLI